MKQVFAYVRVSTDEQTVENQKIALQQYATSNGMQITRFFEDSAVSGKVPATSRKAFTEMIDALRTLNQSGFSPSIHAVLVYELSRVGRTFWDTLDAIKTVDAYTPLISCSPKEAFLQNTDANLRKLLLSIISWVAERERENLVQRTKDGIVRARANGKQIGQPRKNIDTNLLKQLLTEGKSKKVIAGELGISRATLYKHI